MKRLSKIPQSTELLMVNWDSNPDNLTLQPKLQHLIGPYFPSNMGKCSIVKRALRKNIFISNSCSNFKFTLPPLCPQTSSWSLSFSVSLPIKCGKYLLCSVVFED